MNGMFRSPADLFAELNRMQSLMEQVLPTGRTSIRSSGVGFPTVNVGTTPSTIEVMALAPGLDPAKLEITIDRGLLAIAGERQGDLPEARDRTSVYANERFAGKFRRVLSLPEDADPARVEANYREGILRITVHKRESSLPRRIEVN